MRAPRTHRASTAARVILVAAAAALCSGLVTGCTGIRPMAERPVRGLPTNSLANSSSLVFEGPTVTMGSRRLAGAPQPETARNNAALAYRPGRAQTALDAWPTTPRTELDELRRQGLLRDFPLFYATDRFDLNENLLRQRRGFAFGFGPRPLGDPRFPADPYYGNTYGGSAPGFSPGFRGRGFIEEAPINQIRPLLELDPYFNADSDTPPGRSPFTNPRRDP